MEARVFQKDASVEFNGGVDYNVTDPEQGKPMMVNSRIAKINSN